MHEGKELFSGVMKYLSYNSIESYEIEFNNMVLCSRFWCSMFNEK